MTESLAALMNLLPGWIAVSVAVFLRIGALMAVLPAFGEHMVPLRVRLAATTAFTAITAPAVAGALPDMTAGGGALLGALATETVNGLALGLVLRLMILALEIAGTIAAQAMSLSQLFGIGGAPMPAVSHLLVAAGLALAALSGLHVRLAEVLILSYRALPAGQFPLAPALMDWGVGNVAQCFALAFSLALPFVIAATLYNVALGAINKAMPQMMVAFVGAPALTLAALALLTVAAPSALLVWRDAFAHLLADPFGAPR